MVRKGLQFAAVIGASVALSGCASIFGAEFAARWSKPQSVAAPQPELARYTEQGRLQLADNQTGAAIESFRLALLSSEPSDPAYNGMGVAYARLGMFENAQKLFSLAINAAPAEQMYRDNLARLMVSPALALRKDGDRAAAVTAAASPAPPADRPAAATAATAAPGKLTRVSRNEFRIVTVPQSTAPPVRASRPATALARLPKIVVLKPAVPGNDGGAAAASAAAPTTPDIAKPSAVAANK